VVVGECHSPEQFDDDPAVQNSHICHARNRFPHLIDIEIRNNAYNKTENHFSYYPRSQVDINSYTRLKIAMSLIAGKA
jgi:hypothetical protein